MAMATSIPAQYKLPPYVPIIVISRDCIIVLGSVIIHVITGDLKVSPSILGKVTTFFQMITIVSVLLRFSHSYIVWNTAVVLTLASGMDYVIKGSRVLSENHITTKKAG
jgi:phosphatidylglycerophosphate synthase